MNRFQTVLAMAIVAVILLSTAASAGTSLSGSVAGAWTFEKGTTASAFAAGLGVSYRPDTPVPVSDTGWGGYKFVPSDVIFWSQQWFRDGSADLNMTGAGYSLVKVPGFEMLAEGGAVFKGLGESTFRVGCVGLADVRFVTLGKNMAFKLGGGYCDRPLMILSLGFETE